jgi:hypothetical protein
MTLFGIHLGFLDYAICVSNLNTPETLFDSI